MTQEHQRRRRFALTATLILGGLTAATVAACNDTPLIMPPDCHPDQCSCREDPLQARCSGFDTPPPGDVVDASGPVEAGGDASDPIEAGGDASDGTPSNTPDGGGGDSS